MTVASVIRQVLTMKILLVLIYFISFFAVSASPGKMTERLQRERGILVVPGLGRSDRLQVVYDNIFTLLKDESNRDNTNTVEWDCIIYVYTSRKDESLWQTQENIRKWKKLSERCDIIENINKKVTENMYMLQPALLRKTYSYVFLLLDDIKAPTSSPGVILQKMIDILKCNKLTVLSPLIHGANKGGGQKFRNIMQIPPQANTIGYVSSFVEIFAWLMTMPAYEALWELLCPEVNPYAWGYDFWYNGHATNVVAGHRMGILSAMVFSHEQDTTSTGAGRTDNTRVEDKWNAVLAQERHYQKHRGITLAKYRKNLDISNSSWNGAVKGFLYPCEGY